MTFSEHDCFRAEICLGHQIALQSVPSFTAPSEENTSKKVYHVSYWTFAHMIKYCPLQSSIFFSHLFQLIKELGAADGEGVVTHPHVQQKGCKQT